MDNQEIRKEASTLCYQIARNIETLLNGMNENEGAFVVDSDEKTIVWEHDMHDHISKYMKLGLSLEKPKP